MSPMGPAQGYVVKYNGYQVPGYAQSEEDESPMEIASYKAPYHDGALSEYTGMPNKNIAMKFKIWEPTWEDCKNQYFVATTYLRSKRSGRAPLSIGYTDRHYNALTASVSRSKQAGESPRLLEYDVTWEVNPWVERDAVFTVSGTSATTINTDSVGRTIGINGGWSPTILNITGTNVTVSGYTDIDSFTGFISVSGAVANLLVDTDNYTATIGGVNANSRMLWRDYALWVGPGKTYFTIGGTITSVNISWQDRWY
jgi:hypothetical protein